MDAFLVYSVFQVFSYTIGDLLEDLIFGDLGVLKFWVHVPWITITSLIAAQGYASNFYHERSVAMRWNGDVFKSLTNLMCPLFYPTIEFRNPIVKQRD